jgi:DNA-binding MarR family transcriptional regulator
VAPTGSDRQGSSATGDAAFEREFPGSSRSANAAVRALAQTHEAILTFANEALSRHGLSPAARQALGALDGHGSALTPGEVADRLLVTPGSVTSLLDTLERRGLVTRTPDPDDRRRVLVAITEAGRTLVDQFVPEAVALQTAVMSDLSEADRARLTRILATIRETTATLDGAVIVSAVRPRRRRPPRGQPPSPRSPI